MAIVARTKRELKIGDRRVIEQSCDKGNSSQNSKPEHQFLKTVSYFQWPNKLQVFSMLSCQNLEKSPPVTE